MSLPGADLLLNKIREIELAGRAYRGEPSREDMDLARRAVDGGIMDQTTPKRGREIGLA